MGVQIDGKQITAEGEGETAIVEELAGEGGADNEGAVDGAQVLDNAGNESDAAEGGHAADGDVVVSLGEEADAGEGDDKRAPDWVRELRQSNRAKDRKLREQEAELARLRTASQPAAVSLGEKPTLERCEYDAEKFEQELETWHNRKREVEDQKRQREQAEQQQFAQWQTRIDAVKTAATGLKVPDHDDAALAFEDTFSVLQQGIVIGGPDDPKTAALLRYALGTNPKKAQELAAIKDPVKFAFAVAKLETHLKVTNRKAPPPPEKVVRSTVPGAAQLDNTVEKLREEAARTGDMTKLMAYRNQQKAKQRA